MGFDDTFKTGNLERDNFLSRIFGIFNEQVVHYWTQLECSPYITLGRPTVKDKWQRKGRTLDFVLQSKLSPEKAFVAEMKCWLSYDKYRFLRLDDPTILERMTARADQKGLARLFSFAKQPSDYDVFVNQKPVSPRPVGSILIWGAITSRGREATKEKYKFEDVLSVEAMLSDLRASGPWKKYVDRLLQWNAELFKCLVEG